MRLPIKHLSGEAFRAGFPVGNGSHNRGTIKNILHLQYQDNKNHKPPQLLPINYEVEIDKQPSEKGYKTGGI